MRTVLFHRVGSLALAALAACSLLPAQDYRASLLGIVKDSSGAVVPAARVSATNIDTNTRSSTEANGEGNYLIPFLQPGHYRLVVERDGFKTFDRSPIELRINDRVRVDVVLEVGKVSEQFTVIGEPPALETASASMGQVVASKTLQDTPLNGRNVYFMMTSVTGVLPTGRANTSFFLRNSATGVSATAAISISGAPALYNEYLLDGVPTTGSDNGLMYVPSVEATQEFKLQTNSYDAEYGRFLGGVINTSMRSGTNHVHGAAFEFLRNSALNARDFFAASKPKFGYNQFGASLGGPVYIPRLYKGKDRTFFFFIYDGSREGVPRSWVATVPTALERAGDFSKTFTKVSGQAAQVTVYDPATVRLSGSSYLRDAFPGNAIPASRQNSIAQKLLALYPQPAATGDSITRASNFPNAYKDPVLDNGVAFKIDHRFNDRHQIFGRFTWRHFYVRGGGEFVSEDPAKAISTGYVNRYVPGAAIDDTLTVSPTVVLNFRYGFSRYREVTKSGSYGFDPVALGFPSSFKSAVDRPVIPQVTLSGYTGYGSYTYTGEITETHILHAGMLKQTGMHSMRSGFSARLYRHNLGPGGTTSGSYAFDGAFTRGPNPQATSAVAGNGVASMLLGLGSSGSMNYAASVAEQTPYYEVFLQDDIRLTPRLTLNLGIRYEWEGAHTERFNRFSRNFDFTSANPLETQAVAKYAQNPISEIAASQFTVKGGLLFPGQGGLPRGLTGIDRNNVSPRAGAAFTLTPKTVVRGGYGIFFGPTTPQGNTTYGSTASTSWVTTINGIEPVDTLSNPFPNGISRPAGSSNGLLTYVGQGISFFDVSRQQPRTQQFSASVQRQLPGGVLAEASYSGSRTAAYPVSLAIDAIPRQYQVAARQTYLSTGRNTLSDSAANPFYGLISSGSLSGSTTTRGQLMRPYPQFTGISEAGMDTGTSKYDSAQAKVAKRFSNGLSFLASYTAGKLLEQYTYLNDTDAQLTRQLSSYDSPQRFILTTSYQLPIGKGRLLLANAKGIVEKIAGGWQLNGVYTAQSGVPITLASGESTGQSAKLDKDQRTLSRWFDTSAFRLRQTLEFAATSVLPDVRTQGRNNIDLSLYKDTALTESLKLQFRAESFNLSNRTEFGSAGSTVGSSSFGITSSQINFGRQLQFGIRLLW